MIRRKLNTDVNDTALQSLPPSSSSSPPTTTIRVVNGAGLVSSLTGTNNDGPQSLSMTTLPLSEASQPSSAIARRDNDAIPLHIRKEHSFPKMQSPSLRSLRRDLHAESAPRPNPTSNGINPTPRIGQAAPLPSGSRDSPYRSPSMFSSPAPISYAPSVPQRQTTTSTNASPPPVPHNPMARPTVPRSRSHNTFSNSPVARPSTGGTSSAPTSGPWMRPQSAPSRYPNGVGSPYYPPPPPLPNMYQYPGPVVNISNRPSSNSSQAPVYPPPSLHGPNSRIPSKPPSRKPTIEAFVANDPFRPHGQKASSHTVDDNVTFDDIPTPPSPPEESFPNGQNELYMMPQSNYSFAMAKPAVPFSTYPTPPVMSQSEGAPAYPSGHLASGLSGTTSHSTGPTDTTQPEKFPLGKTHTSEYDFAYAYVPVEDIGLNGRRPNTYPGEPAIAEEGMDENNGISPDGQPLDSEGPPVADDQLQRWNPDIPLVPVRRPAESSWYDPYNYDPLRNADDEHPFPIPHTYDHQPLPTNDNVKGFWSAIVNAFFWPFARKNSLLPQSVPNPPGLDAAEKRRLKIVFHFTFKTLPRQLYLYLLLLRLPSLYFSRVARIFEEADLTLPEIKKMALETASQASARGIDAFAFAGAMTVAPQYQKLRTTWESFIDSVMREWKTFNIISVLLLSAILTILQIPGAAEDPITRFSALLSLICALISLLFGCMYIIRFGSMRKTYKAAEWALEAKKTKTVIWWNVWVLLAMPAIWLTWSIVLYIVCIMSFIWRTSAQGGQLPSDLSHRGLLSLRLFITFVLLLGVLYGGLVLRTFRHYGEAMDRAWKTRIDGWIQERKLARVPSFYQPSFYNPPMMPADSSNGGYGSSQAYQVPQMPRYPSQSTSQTPPPMPTTQTPPPYNNNNDARLSADSDTTAESTSSTLYATQSNTLHNKRSTFREEEDVGFPIYKGPGYISNHSLPHDPENWSTTSVHSEQSHVSHKVGIVGTPPPPLRSRPATPIAPISTTKPPNINVYIPTGEREDNYLGFTLEGRPETPENRVRFRSPLISAKDSSFGSDAGLSASIYTSDNTSLAGDVSSSPSTGNSQYLDAPSLIENVDSPSPSRGAFPSDEKANHTGVIGGNDISSSRISHHSPKEIKASQVENTPMLASTSSSPNDPSLRH